MTQRDETERLRKRPETPRPEALEAAPAVEREAAQPVEPALETKSEPAVKAELRPKSPPKPSKIEVLNVEPSIAAPKTPIPMPVPDSGRYAILGSIHRGGMGEILLARVEGREGFARKVVLKGLLARLLEDDVSYQLFMREARLMAALDHPNVVRVFDLPYIAEKPYLAMEYVRGRNFHQVIHRAGANGRGMPARIALHVVSEALRGLHYAHNAKDEQGRPMGIIHRDVSPGNILVSFFGEVKVTDFGIAKIANAPKFTGPRSIRGKARYVAPEQVHGEQASVSSDIYSAGVVLAEALLGEPLWERATVPETLLSIVSEDREKTIDRVLKDRATVPGLRAALRGALSLAPADRFASALQFAETLEAIARSMGGAPTHVDLGLYIRKLFRDAPDLPIDDGFGSSPELAAVELSGSLGASMVEEHTDPTVITLEPEWIKEHSRQQTASMRAADPTRTPKPRRLTPHITPVIQLPDEDTAPPLSTPRIRATPLDARAAVVDDIMGSAEYSFSELIPGLPTDEEPSRDIDNLDPAELARATGRDLRDRTVSESGVTSPHSLTLLVAGIFIGASLAIAGCVLALIIGGAS